MGHEVSVAMLAAILVAGTASASNIDPAQKHAWCENVGWTNWRDADGGADGVNVTTSYLSGMIWSENVGWINVGNGPPADEVHYANDPADSSTFGVNIDLGSGDIFGLAWGENVGWINFDTASAGNDRAGYDDCTHRFYGYAWGENVGWINLNHAAGFVGVGPCGFGDLDCDGDVGLDDYEAFQSMLGGPDVPVDCSAFDWDEDGDIDLTDFAELQAAFAG